MMISHRLVPVTHSGRIPRCLAVLVLVILLLPFVPLQAVPGPPDLTGEFAMETWLTENGLPQSSVNALLQTRKGYIWAATYNGIAQFDGEQFKIFNSANTPGLRTSSILTLFEDARGVIWIGHDTGELTRYDGVKFEPVPLGEHWPGGPIYGIGADENQDLWLLNLRGAVMRLRDSLLLPPVPGMVQEPNWKVPQLVGGSDHKLFVVRSGVVAQVEPAGLHEVKFASDSAQPYFMSIGAAQDGGMWVADEARLRKCSDQKWTADLGLRPWGSGFLTGIMETTSHRVLVGTLDQGLYVFDEAGGYRVLRRADGLPQDRIHSLLEDREHNLWVGTSGGLVVLRPRKVVTYSPPDEWLGRPVLSLAPAWAGGVWAATEGAGIYHFDGTNWTHFGESTGLSNQFVWSVLEDSRGRVWAGTWGGGLFVREHDQFTRAFELSQLSEPVTALSEGRDGELWVGTGSGLWRVVAGRLESLTRLGGAAAGPIRAFEQDAEGALWLGTQGEGLGRLKQGEFKTFLPADGLPGKFILSLHADPDGTLWIGTLDHGVCRYKNGRFASVTTAQGLPNNIIDHIEDDQLGNLWFNSQRGIFRLSKADLNRCLDHTNEVLQPLIYGRPEGLATLAGAGGFTPSGFRAADGRLWFPTTRGLAVVNPKTVRLNFVLPPVWIEEVLADRQRLPIHSPNEPSKTSRGAVRPDSATRSVEVPAGTVQLELRFTALSFASPDRVRFRYRFAGLDANWTEAGSRRTITYSFLPPGEYRFQVIACNGDGFWNQEGDVLLVRVLPFFWQTAWFKLGLGLFAAGLVGGSVFLVSRQRMRRKLERFARASELERERARIAQDIHDDLGASLTRIGMLSQSAAGNLNLNPPRAITNLNQIYTTARELTRAMDEIVWAVNPKHDSLESLTNYLTRFAQDFLGTAQIRCRLDVPLRVPNLTVRSEIRHNLFLAFKETLNNVVKHTQANEVRITMTLAAPGLHLIVADNGAGFDLAARQTLRAEDRLASGNGLANLRSRLEQVGGRCVIQSGNGEGTRVELFVPLSGLSLELTTTTKE